MVERKPGGKALDLGFESVERGARTPVEPLGTWQ